MLKKRLFVSIKGHRGSFGIVDLLVILSWLTLIIVSLLVSEPALALTYTACTIQAVWLQFLLSHNSAVTQKVDELFGAIKHGDEVHQAWLRMAIDDHFAPDLVTINRAIERKGRGQ